VSGLTDSRLALGSALAAAGLRVSYDPGLVTPPAVLVAAADPWLSPSFLVTVSAQVRWRVVAVAGRVDVAVTVLELEDLVAAIVVALGDLPDGWSRPTFDGPGTTDLGGTTYLAAVGRLDHLTEV
jgi:hypothetical protein